MDPQVDQVLAAARSRGIEIGERIGGNGYCEQWAVGDSLVMRIPRVVPSDGPKGLIEHGAGPLFADALAKTRPSTFVGIKGPQLATAFFKSALERQRDVVCASLARFVDRLELADTVVSLHERPPGHPIRSAEDIRLPALAKALLELHAKLGFHGDLRPGHIYVDGDRVTFTDPAPNDMPGIVIGCVGYTLPVITREGNPRDEAALLRDLGALAAIVAEARGAPLGWDRHLERLMACIHNGGYGHGWTTRAEIQDLHARIENVDGETHVFVRAIGDLVLGHYEVGLPSPGTTQRYLESYARAPSVANLNGFRAALAPIAQLAYETPSLMEFLVAETTQPNMPALFALFERRAEALERLVDVARELRELYVEWFGEPVVVAPAPLTQPSGVFDESWELRTLLVDLDRLLDPEWYTPTTLGEVGGMLARIDQMFVPLREDTSKLYMAARRYVNYLGRA